MPVARTALPTVLALILAACSRPAGAPASSPSPATLDPGRPLPSPMPEVVARVNGEPIRLERILPMAKAELDEVKEAERERKMPEVLRHALRRYVDRELLVQEAVARGIEADSRQVEWAYDQLRRDHADDAKWAQFLAEQGLDPGSLRAELRAQHTVTALLEQELRQVTGEGGEASPERRAEIQDALLARLRVKARIEILL
jgi:hypothetical protein